MEVEIFTLSDFAQDTNGKLTIVGTFDNVNAVSYPYTLPQCAVATRIRFANKEFGSHNGQLRFKHGEANFMPNLDFNVDVKTHPTGYQGVNLILNINNLVLKESGKYTVELFIDGNWKTGLTFFSNQIQKAA